MADSTTHVCSGVLAAHAVNMQVYTIVVAVIACLDARAVSRRDARAARKEHSCTSGTAATDGKDRWLRRSQGRMVQRQVCSWCRQCEGCQCRHASQLERTRAP